MVERLLFLKSIAEIAMSMGIFELYPPPEHPFYPRMGFRTVQYTS